MFEALVSFVAPIIKDVLIATATLLVSYLLNKIQSKLQSF